MEVNVYSISQASYKSNGILIKQNYNSVTTLPFLTQNVDSFDSHPPVVTYNGQYLVLTQYVEKLGKHLVWTILTLTAIYFFVSFIQKFKLTLHCYSFKEGILSPAIYLFWHLKPQYWLLFIINILLLYLYASPIFKCAALHSIHRCVCVCVCVCVSAYVCTCACQSSVGW